MARQYRRNARGQFASNSDTGAKVTSGRAGGFANATFRARVANNRAAAARRQKLAKGAAKAGGAVAAAAVVSAAAGRKSIKQRPAGDVTQTVRRAVQPIVRTIRQ